MSRTDRHRPDRVQQADPSEQNFYWFHQGLSFGWRKMFIHHTCACRWHSNHYEAIEENRRRRHDDQRRARQAAGGRVDVWDWR